jgi:chemotaxis-related protein WspD
MSNKLSRYYSLANQLLEKPVDDKYLEEWTRFLIAEEEGKVKKNAHSVVVFRLGQDWLGLSTLAFAEVSKMRPVRRIPHRTNEVLKGFINIRGQLYLCIDLAKVLEIEQAAGPGKNDQQMAVTVSKNQNDWVFVADEVLGVFLYDTDDLTNVPVTVSKSTANYLKGIMIADHRHISILDEDLLFYSLEKRVE